MGNVQSIVNNYSYNCFYNKLVGKNKNNPIALIKSCILYIVSIYLLIFLL